MKTSVRLLRLLSLLQVRGEWSGVELADRLEVTTRTIRNDIGRLRELGYEISSRSGTAGGYRLSAGAVLPPLLLDDEEAVAVAIGLRVAASGSVTGLEETSLRALLKLEQTLPARLRPRLDAVRTSTVAVGGGPSVDPETLTAVARACHDRQQLRFDYSARDGADQLRRVEPHRLVCTGRRWYLFAWDCDREAWRTFRADRIRPRLPAGPTFQPREPPEDAATHVVRGTGSLAWRHPAKIRLHAPMKLAAEQIPPPAGLLTPLSDHTCLFETGSDSLPNLIVFLTRLDIPFEVLDPPELQAHLRDLAHRYLAAAEPPQAR